MNNATNYPPTPRTLKQLEADPRIHNIEYCSFDRRYFVWLTDDWKEDGFCRGFSAPTVKATIATLLSCTPADPAYNYDLGCTYEEARLDAEVEAATDDAEWTVEMAQHFLTKSGLPTRRTLNRTAGQYWAEAGSALGHLAPQLEFVKNMANDSIPAGTKESIQYFTRERSAWVALAIAKELRGLSTQALVAKLEEEQAKEAVEVAQATRRAEVKAKCDKLVEKIEKTCPDGRKELEELDQLHEDADAKAHGDIEWDRFHWGRVVNAIEKLIAGIGVSNAQMGIDQADIYRSLAASLAAYEQNARDTVVTEVQESIAITAFEEEVERLRKSEAGDRIKAQQVRDWKLLNSTEVA